MNIISTKQAKEAVKEIQERTEWLPGTIAVKAKVHHTTIRSLLDDSAVNVSEKALNKIQALYDFVIENTEPAL